MRQTSRIWLSVLTAVACSLSAASHAQDIDEEVLAATHGISTNDVRRLQQYRGLTSADLLEMSTPRVRRTLWKLDNPRPDQPYEAAEFRRLQQAGDLSASIPENALSRAIARVQEMRAAIAARSAQPRTFQAFPSAALGTPIDIATVAGMPVGEVFDRTVAPSAPGPSQADPRAGMLQLELQPLLPATNLPGTIAVPQGPGGISPARWKWLGPGNVGGRTRSILIHPANANVMWLGAVAGGIWKTIDGGQSWAPLADFMASLNVSTMVLDPSNPDVIYAGSGEGHYNLDAFRGAGIFRSSDGGATWTQLRSTAGPSFHYVNRLAITADGNALLAATRVGIFRSTNFRDPNTDQVSFTRIAGVIERDILDVDCAALNGQRCVAGGRGRTAYFSTDGGQTWSQTAGLPQSNPDERLNGRVEITFAVADPSIVYASVDNNQGEIYRSDDGGQTFKLRHTGSQYLSAQGWYDNVIWAGDPSRPDLVIVGGIDLHRSLNGGLTLTRISEWWKAPRSAHADHHAIAAHPGYNGTSNRIVFFCNDGGIYRNDDVLAATPDLGWVSLNNTYGVTQFYGAAGNALTGRIVAGAQDNGTVVYAPPPGPNSGVNGYSAIFGGDGGYSAADPTNPNFMYGEYVYLQIHRSVDGGSGRSNYIYRGIADAERPDRALFIAPFILDPRNAETMLAGGRSLWRSRNVTAATPAWEEIRGPISSAGGRAALVSAIDARSFDASAVRSEVVWVGYSNGHVARTLDGQSMTPTWQRVGHSGPSDLPNRYVTRIRIDPRDANIVYVAFSGYASGNLWKTTDGAATWKNIGGLLPEASIYDVAVHPSDSNLLYLASEVGVFASGDAGETWWPTNQGPANVAVSELFWMDQKLVAVTHGRGIFWIDLSQAPLVAAAPSSESGPAALRLPPSGPPADAFSSEQTRRTDPQAIIAPVSPLNAR